MISKAAVKEITVMITAFPAPENESVLKMLIEHGHMDETAVAGRSIFSVVLEDLQVH